MPDPFSDWGHVDGLNLHKIRRFTCEKLVDVIHKTDEGPILEVGPNKLNGANNSGIYQTNPEYFVNTNQLCSLKSIDYWTLDTDPLVEPDILSEIDKFNVALPDSFFNAIICFSVLEHVRDLNNAVSNLTKMLRAGGKLHLISPWDFRFHGPRPDCWRISDDGYRWLLNENFHDITFEFLENSGRPLSPIAIYVSAIKI